MDIFILLILIVSTVRGGKTGFFLAAKSLLQWLLCVVFAFLFSGEVKNALTVHTSVDEWVLKKLALRFNGLTDSSVYRVLSHLFPEWARDAGDVAFSSVVSMVMTVLSFIIIVIGVQFLCRALSRLFMRKHRGNRAMGFVDEVLGAVFGFGRGIFYVLFIFLVFIPLLSVWFPSVAAPLAAEMENSFIAGLLYDNKIFLSFLKKL